MKIIILVGSEADKYAREHSELEGLAQYARAVARHAVKLAKDLKTIATEGDTTHEPTQPRR